MAVCFHGYLQAVCHSIKTHIRVDFTDICSLCAIFCFQGTKDQKILLIAGYISKGIMKINTVDPKIEKSCL